MATRDYSDLQEKQISKLVNGKVQSNSGGTRFGGGDIVTETFLIEAKTPTKTQTSFSIKEEWITKAKEQAFEQGKSNSALAIRFDPQGDDYFLVDKRLFQHLVQMLDKEEL